MKSKVKKISIGLIGLIAVFILGKILIGVNFIYLFKVWLSLMIIGIIFYPITSIIFKSFNDKGWIFSKIIGVAITAVVVWWLSYIRIIKFSTFSIYFMLAIALIITLFVFFIKKVNVKEYVKSIPLNHIIVTEIIFVISLTCWIYIRSYKVPIDAGTEQFMNYGFMNKIMNSSNFPVEDIWFSGNHINYYYFGQYIAAFINMVSGIDAKPGYGLMLSLVSSMTVVMPFSIALNLGISIFKKYRQYIIKKFLPYVLAIVAGLSVAIGGTLYYPVYNWIIPRAENDEYSYWEAVRYIGYRPETNDKTITDIPAYSNVAQDLHAHYTDLIFVFTTLAILLALLYKERKDEEEYLPLWSLSVFLLGIILGVQKMTNYWDFPIYGVVISIILIANNLLKYKITPNNIINTIGQVITVFATEELVTIPFTHDLYMSSNQVLFTGIMSPLYKLAVLWALPTICVIFNFILLIIKVVKQKQINFIDRVRNLEKSDIFVILIGLCAVGLVIMPEIVYVKDIYGDEYKRANTMFKLTYQAFVLFSISSSYVVIKYLVEKGSRIKNIIAAILLIIHLSTFSYGISAIQLQMKYNKQTNDLANVEGYIKKYYKYDYDAIQWIKENISKDEVILEKVSGSYEVNGRISVFTGNPTVLAWYGHEWIWRSDKDYLAPLEQKNRWNKIFELYTCGDSKKIKEIAKDYNISYVYVGELENQEIAYNIDSIVESGEIVYQKFDNESNKYIYLIKIDK